jgi:hypothetical protein
VWVVIKQQTQHTCDRIQYLIKAHHLFDSYVQDSTKFSSCTPNQTPCTGTQLETAMYIYIEREMRIYIYINIYEERDRHEKRGKEIEGERESGLYTHIAYIPNLLHH